MFTWLRRNGSFRRTHSTPGITSTTSVGPGGVSQGYRSASPADCVGCAFEFIGCNRYVVSHRLSGTSGAAPAEKADAGFAIPHGYLRASFRGCAKHRTPALNCAPENLEIPGSSRRDA